MKKCTKCNNPSLSYHHYCRWHHTEYQKQWYKNNPISNLTSVRNRKARIREYIKVAKSIPCKDCKISYPWYVMDFDHKKDKEFNLSEAARKLHSIERVKKEIAKCDVVCANCHRERTFNKKSLLV